LFAIKDESHTLYVILLNDHKVLNLIFSLI
jgi:hypothetical protein